MVGTVNPPDAAAPFAVTSLEQDALDHVWVHALSWREQAEQDGFRVFERGKNSTLWDSRGDAYLDVISGLWVVNAGHGRKEIAAAMGEQAEKLAYASVTAFTTEPAARLAATLAEITPGDLNRVFFVSGGSESVETALKIAKQVQAMRGFPRRYKVIARRGSYHGMTQGALSLTASRERSVVWAVPIRRLPRPASRSVSLRLRRRGRAGRSAGGELGGIRDRRPGARDGGRRHRRNDLLFGRGACAGQDLLATAAGDL